MVNAALTLKKMIRIIIHGVFGAGITWFWWSTALRSHSLNLLTWSSVLWDSRSRRWFSSWRFSTLEARTVLDSCSFRSSASNWETRASRLRTSPSGVGERELDARSLLYNKIARLWYDLRWRFDAFIRKYGSFTYNIGLNSGLSSLHERSGEWRLLLLLLELLRLPPRVGLEFSETEACDCWGRVGVCCPNLLGL